jgi:ferredoxin
MVIKIRKNLCTECGSCVEECPLSAIKVSPDKGPVIDLAKCDECLKCVETCPSNALLRGP